MPATVAADPPARPVKMDRAPSAMLVVIGARHWGILGGDVTGERGHGPARLRAEGDIEGVAALFSNDAVVADGGGLGVAGTAAGTLHGPEGFFQSASEAQEAFDDYEVETEHFISAGQAVVVAVRISGKGRASGFFTDIEDAGPDLHIGIRELEAIGERHVLASLAITTTGRASAIALGAPTTNLYEFEDGRIRRARIYLDHAEAVGALETSE